MSAGNFAELLEFIPRNHPTIPDFLAQAAFPTELSHAFRAQAEQFGGFGNRDQTETGHAHALSIAYNQEFTSGGRC